MSKSKETYSKKETQKNKEKKRKEKEQRREERKAANAKAGKSLEDMLAYVDENGNITSTMPDPTKKRVIKEEDIVIGVRKQEPRSAADLIRKGRVTFFNSSKDTVLLKTKAHKKASLYTSIPFLARSRKETKLPFRLNTDIRASMRWT